MKRKLTSILAADIVGFSRLIEAAEEETLTRQKELRTSVFDPGVELAGGKIIKSTGDGFLAEFPSVVDALRFAISAQQAVVNKEASRPEDRRISYRIGVHLGDVVVDDGDIFGDGVNLASRLEGVAPAGGICISTAVRDQIVGVMDDAFTDVGELTLKNISRPIRAFVWRQDQGDNQESNAVPSAAVARRKPTVSLGAFEALGNNDDAQLLAEACHHTVEAALANLTGLDLIDPEVGPEHIATAVFQAVGNQVRATLKLRETRTSETYLTQRMNGDLSDPFAAEDLLSGEIATTIRYGILQRDAERASETGSNDPETMLTVAGHYMMGSQIEEWAAAGRLLDRILEVQPRNFMAVAMKANTLIGEIIWGYRPVTEEDTEASDAGLRLAVSLNDQSDYVHLIRGIFHYGITGDLDAAVRCVERAFEINPQFAQAHMVLGWIQNLMGEPELALKSIEKGSFSLAKNRIYHRVPQAFAQTYLVLGDFDKAIENADRALQNSPGLPIAQLYLASAAGQSGRRDHGERARQGLLTSDPDFRISRLRRFHFRDPARWEAILDGLRAVELPE